MKCISKPDRIFGTFAEQLFEKNLVISLAPQNMHQASFHLFKNPSNPFKKNVGRKKYRSKLLKTHQKY